MKTYKIFVLLIMALMLAACPPPYTGTPRPRSTPTPRPYTYTPTQPVSNAWANAPQVALLVRADLMLKLSLDPDAIQLIRVDQIDWPDACLGIYTPGKVCAQVITPGYRVVLGAYGREYEYRTDEDRNTVVLVNP